MRPAPPLPFRRVRAGAVLRLPRLFWLYRWFRKRFRKARPGRRAWVWIVAGRSGFARLARFWREAEPHVAVALRRREQTRRDAEWNAAAPGARGLS